MINKSSFENNIIDTTGFVKNLPSVLEINKDLLVVGDLHGDHTSFEFAMNLREKLNLDHVVFLGDFVDRGKKQVEVINSLCEALLNEPNKIHLIRGNHEEVRICSTYGFKTALRKNNLIDLFPKIELLFEAMPVFLVQEKTAVMAHGGIPISENGVVTKNEIFKEKAKIDFEPTNGIQCMWNDPIEAMYTKDMWATEFIVENPRMPIAYCYTRQRVKNFIEEWQVKRLIRGHIALREGNREFNDLVLSLHSASSGPYEGFNRSYAVSHIGLDPIIHNFPNKG